MESLLAEDAARQDDETRGFQRLAETTRLPLLLGGGWQRVKAGGDGLGWFRHRRRQLVAIHSICRERDGEVWAHVSVSCGHGRMPSWEVTRDVFREVCGHDAVGIIVVPPVSEHVNLREVAHVWSCLTTRPIPDFSAGLGTI